MRRSVTALLVALLAVSALWAGQVQQTPTPIVRKRPAVPAKPADPPATPEAQSLRRAYAALTIGELVGQDPNRWTENMATYAEVGGFVTQVTTGEDGDTDIRICENPKVAGMDRERCIEAECIPRLPCDVPGVGKPVTVRGITRYDAKTGNHWWEIHPVEQIDK
jgi:hypothetical protein